MIAGSGGGQPGWLASFDYHIGRVINGYGTPLASQANLHMSAHQMAMMQTKGTSGYWFILLFALIQLAIGIAVFLPRFYRISGLSLGILLSVVFWVVGQSFGGVFTGLATDPGSAPLFILLAITILGCSTLSSDLSRFFKRFEHIIT
jgi:hypothetical protein